MSENKSNYGNVKRRMKKVNDKKKSKNKQKQKQKQQQTNKQTISLNISSSGGGGGSGGSGSSQTRQPQYLPSSFVNEEHTTLLKSINEQLKKKNEPAKTTQHFIIPEPTRPQEIPAQFLKETPIKVERTKENIPNQFSEEERIKTIDSDYADINKHQQVLENEMQGLPQQFREKLTPIPIISSKPAEK